MYELDKKIDEIYEGYRKLMLEIFDRTLDEQDEALAKSVICHTCIVLTKGGNHNESV